MSKICQQIGQPKGNGKIPRNIELIETQSWRNRKSE